jgi:hypothetical protein
MLNVSLALSHKYYGDSHFASLAPLSFAVDVGTGTWGLVSRGPEAERKPAEVSSFSSAWQIIGIVLAVVQHVLREALEGRTRPVH